MTPDEEHEQYYKQFPNGNHPDPSPETLRFMDNQSGINEKLFGALSDIDKKLAVSIEIQNQIHEQTKKTNGRVTKIESEVLPKIIAWQNMLKGAWIGLTALLIPVAGLVIAIWVNIKH